MSAPEQLEIRAYRPGDEEAIVRGFRATFGVERTLEEWRWSFPPVAGSRTIEVAYDGQGELIAHYAAIPVAMQSRGGALLGGQVVDVFTRRKLGLFRRRGPLTRTIESFLARHCGPGRIDLLFGFPSLRAAALGRATEVYPAEAAVERFTLATACAPARRPRWRRAVQLGWERTALDRLWLEAAARYPLSAIRDADRFLRRYVERPGRDYLQLGVRRRGRVRAWGVATFAQERARWVDLLWDGDDDGDLALLAAEIHRRAAASGAGEIELWLSGDDAAAAVVADLGWRRQVHPELRLVGRSFTPRLGDREIVDHLYVTLGDSDLA